MSTDLDQEQFILGLEALKNGQVPHAKKIFQELSKLFPLNTGVMRNLAVCKAMSGEVEEAIALLRKLAKIEPTDPDHHLNLYQAYHLRRKTKRALVSLIRASNLAPNRIENAELLAASLHRLGYFERASVVFMHLHSLTKSKVHWSNSLICQAEFTDITDKLTDVPESELSEELRAAYAKVKVRLGRFDDGMADLKALVRNSGHPAFEIDLAQIYLRLGRYPDAWEHYELRPRNKKIKELAEAGTLRLEKKDDYQGAARLIVVAEQGIGDTILFLQALKNFPNDLDKSKLLVFCDERLVDLLRDTMPNFCFSSQPRIQPGDRYLELGSLCKFFELSPELRTTIPRPGNWAEKPVEIERLVICPSSFATANGRVKSVLFLDLPETLSRLIKIAKSIILIDAPEGWLCLNKTKSPDVRVLSGKNFSEVVNSISTADCVISCSNSYAHLAGHLGKKTHVVIQRNINNFWYWDRINKTTNQSLIYPNLWVWKSKIFSERISAT